jgi:hypothetical protein
VVAGGDGKGNPVAVEHPKDPTTEWMFSLRFPESRTELLQSSQRAAAHFKDEC